jgi:hypothetical protein
MGWDQLMSASIVCLVETTGVFVGELNEIESESPCEKELSLFSPPSATNLIMAGPSDFFVAADTSAGSLRPPAFLAVI